MRTLVDIPDESLRELNELGRQRKQSRAHLVRCAIAQYLEGERQRKPDTLDEAFGMWKDRGIDGLEYQLKMRAEWDHRP